MDEYTGFARVYEQYMDNVPYEKWSEYICDILKEYGVKKGDIVLDLGCGTGTMTRLLAKAGYDMIGVDLSEEMLEIARFEHDDFPDNDKILYLNQDMRDFELYGTVAAAVSICDSMNYITEEEGLLEVFKHVNNYLDKEGIFIFDMNTIHKYEDVIGDRVIAENRDESSLIWENWYDKENKINQYNITIYSKVDFEEDLDENAGEMPVLYERMEEVHVQRGYTIEKVKELIEKAGMEFVAVYAEGTKEQPSENTERMYFIVKEKKQEGKLYK